MFTFATDLAVFGRALLQPKQLVAELLYSDYLLYIQKNIAPMKSYESSCSCSAPYSTLPPACATRGPWIDLKGRAPGKADLPVEFYSTKHGITTCRPLEEQPIADCYTVAQGWSHWRTVKPAKTKAGEEFDRFAAWVNNQTSRNDGWIPVKEGVEKPDEVDFPVWVHVESGPWSDPEGVMLVSDRENFIFNLARTTHWKPATLPKPPKIPTQAERDGEAYQQWAETAPPSRVDSFYSWFAALAYARKETKS